jgi:hypothetical protein
MLSQNQLANPRTGRGSRGHGKQGFRAGTAIETGVSGGPPLDCCKRPPAAAFSEEPPQVRLDPPGYSGLRGEGSIPVPLPPPDCVRQCVLRPISLVIGPDSPRRAGGSYLGVGKPADHERQRLPPIRRCGNLNSRSVRFRIQIQ